MTDKNVVHTMYLLHGLAPFSFWTLAVVAVIIGLMKEKDLQGSYLATHVSWLARTFWFGLLWIAVAGVITVILFITVVGILLLWLPWVILTVWYWYRLIKGWLRLNDGQPV